jgi:branched-subunit amino acid aminotransferase/4-amino-4-deoxychorismate lyase
MFVEQILPMLICQLSAVSVSFTLPLLLLLQSGQLTPIDLIVEEHFHRAAPGGMGGTKAAGNYSPVLVTQLDAKKNNYAGEGWEWAEVGGSSSDYAPCRLPDTCE